MHIKRQLLISREDLERLESLFVGDIRCDFSEQPNLRSLRRELENATIVEPDEMPPDVVTLDSTVRLGDSRSSYENSYTLVTPGEAAITDDHLSVLAPVGTAILGYRVGDNVRWPVPGGTAQFRIREVVFQPERDGIVL